MNLLITFPVNVVWLSSINLIHANLQIPPSYP
jgi:hypothetical protein